MEFHLDYTPPRPDFRIDHDSKIFLIGSCFSENIGNYLNIHKFRTLSNPSGILFNPESIYISLKNILTKKGLDEKHILFRNSLYYSYQHHSSVYDRSKEGLAEKINQMETLSYDFVSTCDTIIITFGNAFIYEHKKLGECVANCHKQPGMDFEKKLLTVNDIVKKYSELFTEIRGINPKARIVLTVSPVKYLKDGVVENNLSKAVLLLAVHQLAREQNCFYFPSFEIVNDDLRDYRFYKEDLAHPNPLAIDYVWQKFSDCFFSDATKGLNQLIKKLHQAADHRLLNEYSDEADKLTEFIRKQKEEIKKLNPNIQF
jgi:hypothetical protein